MFKSISILTSASCARFRSSEFWETEQPKTLYVPKCTPIVPYLYPTYVPHMYPICTPLMYPICTSLKYISNPIGVENDVILRATWTIELLSYSACHFTILTSCRDLGRLDSRVVFTLDYNEYWYAAPWAVRSILGDNHSFSAQA